MKRIFSASVAVFFFYLLQSSAFRGLSFGSAVPNLLLIACVSYGWLRGSSSGILVGFFGGLLMDIFSMGVLGMYALFYMYAGFISGLAHPWYDPREFRIPLILIFVEDALLSLLRFLFFYVMNGDFRFRFFFTGRLLPELAATAILAVIIYPLLLWIEERFIRPDMDEKLRQAESDIAALGDGDRKEGTV
ncbi:MAG: rod shape-determining protein MreD [Lachnospiraceae bacterium]|nr:rod shape-determining protein MreD [Lachnospiraceae bacterium]